MVINVKTINDNSILDQISDFPGKMIGQSTDATKKYGNSSSSA